MADSSGTVTVGVEDIIAATDAGDGSPLAPVSFEELGAADWTLKGVENSWLKDRFDLLLIAGCAKAMSGLAVSFAFAKFIDERTHIRFNECVARRLSLKVVNTTLFLLKVQKRAFDRYMIRLGLDDLVIKVGDDRLGPRDVRLWSFEHSPDILHRVGSPRNGASGGIGQPEQGRDFRDHENLPWVGGSLEEDRHRGALERLPVPQPYRNPKHPSTQGGCVMARLFRALARLDDHWAGDLIACVSLFGIGWMGLFLGYAWGIK